MKYFTKTSFSKKLNLILIFFSIIVFFYIVYRDFIHYENQKNYTISYLIVLLIILILIITLNLNNHLRSNIITVFISILTSLYLVEILIFLNLNYKFLSDFKKDFDKRTKFEVYQDLKKQDPNIYPAIFPVNFINEETFDKNSLIPLGNISNKNILWCNENGYYVTFDSDQHGFRNNNSIWKSNFINFTFLGDSYVEGACVKSEDTISENLSKISNQNVLNLARGGNGPLLNLATLYEFSKLSKGSKLFWFYYEGNDIGDMKKELKSSQLKKYLRNINFTQNLKFRQEEIDEFLKKYSEEKIQKFKNNIDHNLNELSPLKIFKLFNLRYNLQLFILSISNKKIKIEESDLETFVKIVNKAKNFSINKGADFYFVYLPSYNRYITNQKENFLSKKILIKKLNEKKIKVIDLDLLVFDQIVDKLNLFPLRRSGHYNERGYREVANAILKYIENE